MQLSCIYAHPAVRLTERFSMTESEAATTHASCTLHVCTSCRPSGMPREPRAERPGSILYRQIRDAVDSSPLRDRVDVRPTKCLSLCPRPCGIALSSPRAWTYLFGDQDPHETTADVMDCVSLYLQSPEGFMARRDRPKPLRASILRRVPPLQEGRPCT